MEILLSQIKDSSIHYVIAGKGDQHDSLIQMAKDLKIDKQLHLIGYRSDISELYKMADIYILPSIREGLNVSVMEAMSSGLPCIVSDIRGNRDLIDDNKGGYLVSPNDSKEIARKIVEIQGKETFGEYNRKKSKFYDCHVINEQMKSIYEGKF